MFSWTVYNDGEIIGYVKPMCRRWKIGRPTYWAAYHADGEWMWSYYSRKEAIIGVTVRHNIRLFY